VETACINSPDVCHRFIVEKVKGIVPYSLIKRPSIIVSYLAAKNYICFYNECSDELNEKTTGCEINNF
jgi:hypothetical protein